MYIILRHIVKRNYYLKENILFHELNKYFMCFMFVLREVYLERVRFLRVILFIKKSIFSVASNH